VILAPIGLIFGRQVADPSSIFWTMEICFRGLEAEFLVEEQKCFLEISCSDELHHFVDQMVILCLIELNFDELVQDSFLFILNDRDYIWTARTLSNLF
jgi:hypothetical protein